MNDEVKTPEDPILKEIAEIDAGMEALIAKNQELGAQIDGIREQRREINAAIFKLQARRGLLATSLTNDAVRSVVIEGATVVASGKELIAAIAAKFAEK